MVFTPWMGSICATRWRTRWTGWRWWWLGAGVYLVTGVVSEEFGLIAATAASADGTHHFGGIAAGVRRAA
jgi:hypothetical protein